jgi:DNA ligase 1
MFFENAKKMIDELNSTNSNNEKIEVLSKYNTEEMRKLFEYTYSPFKQFYVTSKTIDNYKCVYKNKVIFKEEDVYDMLDRLSKREITGHDALAFVNEFIITFPDYKDLIFMIIDKNLKIRMNAASINKVFQNLIPEFKVQLAETIDRERIPDFKNNTWFYSRKLDGNRCLAIVKDNDIKFFSRSGKEFLVLDKVRTAIQNELIGKDFLPSPNFVLDGEICIVDDNGNENFAGVMKEIRKKDHTIEKPRYKIFDILTLEDFINQKSVTKFDERYDTYIKIESKSGILDPVEQIQITSLDMLNKQEVYSNEQGWEGLIIRKNVPYAGKRSKDMLKVKSFHDAEYVVLSTVNSINRIISPVTGLEIEEEMLSSVVIDHKGYKVNVGSGFSIEQRQEFFKHPENIIGKTICVKYFEETADQNGDLSLRFPTLKTIYDGEREE